MGQWLVKYLKFLAPIGFDYNLKKTTRYDYIICGVGNSTFCTIWNELISNKKLQNCTNEAIEELKTTVL